MANPRDSISPGADIITASGVQDDMRAHKSNPSDDGNNQSDKFKQTARDLGVELDEDKLKETLRKIAKPAEKDRADDER